MGIREKPTTMDEVQSWRGDFPVEYLYTAGVAGERFTTTLRERGLLAATRCQECGVTYLPPRIYCAHCFADLSGSWVEVPPRGVVHTHTVLLSDEKGQPLRDPEVLAYILIDQTDGGILGRVAAPPEAVAIGMPVEGVLAPPAERRGAITDIRYFKPISS